MKSVYRYRQERHFAKPPAAIWPFVSDSARIVELAGMAPYRFEERVDGQGKVRRFARGKIGPFPVSFEEDFGEWQENRRFLKFESTGTVRCGVGSSAASYLLKARVVGCS